MAQRAAPVCWKWREEMRVLGAIALAMTLAAVAGAQQWQDLYDGKNLDQW